MSEGMLFFVRLDDPQEVKLETCGRPICPDDEVRLVDDEGREVADGEVGELTCRGPYTLRGYFGVPEYNARQFTPDGFYRSGDLMRKHPSGNYVVEGRKKDLINRGGEKISAEEIENLILMHPSVQNVACVPVPDANLGEKMCACLILRPGKHIDLPELVDFLKAREIAKFQLIVCGRRPVSSAPHHGTPKPALNPGLMNGGASHAGTPLSHWNAELMPLSADDQLGLLAKPLLAPPSPGALFDA